MEEVVGADDVGLDELAGAVDGAVDVALGGEVHDCVGAVLVEDGLKGGGIAEVDLLKMIVRVPGQIRQGLGITGVSELVEVNHLDTLLFNK